MGTALLHPACTPLLPLTGVSGVVIVRNGSYEVKGLGQLKTISVTTSVLRLKQQGYGQLFEVTVSTPGGVTCLPAACTAQLTFSNRVRAAVT